MCVSDSIQVNSSYFRAESYYYLLNETFKHKPAGHSLLKEARHSSCPSDLSSDPDHLDVLKSSLLQNERLQPAHHAVFAVEKVGL